MEIDAIFRRIDPDLLDLLRFSGALRRPRGRQNLSDRPRARQGFLGRPCSRKRLSRRLLRGRCVDTDGARLFALLQRIGDGHGQRVFHARTVQRGVVVRPTLRRPDHVLERLADRARLLAERESLADRARRGVFHARAVRHGVEIDAVFGGVDHLLLRGQRRSAAFAGAECLVKAAGEAAGVRIGAIDGRRKGEPGHKQRGGDGGTSVQRPSRAAAALAAAAAGLDGLAHAIGRGRKGSVKIIHGFPPKPGAARRAPDAAGT